MISAHKLLGHSTPQTTLTTYSHYFQEARVKAGNAIANVLLDRRTMKRPQSELAAAVSTNKDQTRTNKKKQKEKARKCELFGADGGT